MIQRFHLALGLHLPQLSRLAPDNLRGVKRILDVEAKFSARVGNPGRDAMHSARTNFVFAIRLILFLFFLASVASYVSAQEDDKTPSEQSSTPQAPRNPRPAARQEGKTTGGNKNPKTGGGASQSPVNNTPARSVPSARQGSVSDDGSSKSSRGSRWPSASASGGDVPSTNTAQDAPGAPDDKPAPRGPRSSGPGRSGSSTDNAIPNPGPSRNAQAGRGPSDSTPTQPASPISAGDEAPASTDKPTRGARNDRPGRGGSSTNKPARGSEATNAVGQGDPSKSGPAGRGPSNKPADRPGKSVNASEKNSSGSGKSNSPRAGFTRTTRANGTVVDRDKNGKTREVTTTRGTKAKLDDRGRVTTIRDKAGNTINRGPRGERRVETVRADRSRVVSIGRRSGYVERPFDRGGREYLRRTYVIGGHSYVHVYRGYHYHGVPYFVYVPTYYYAPAYYGWVFNPWPRPVYYSWGWYGSPWYRPYGYYFAPYPVYPYASLWLTDYLIAENLRLAYEADQLDANQHGNNSPRAVLAAYHPAGQAKANQPAVLTPEVKQMIADEVKAVIADQQKGASSASGVPSASSGGEVPPALDPNHRVFVVFSVLEADADGDTCSLTSSDVVKRVEDTPDDNNTVGVQVLASKNSDCAIGSTVRVQPTDLNDMRNHLSEQADAGMKILAEKQGKDGLPAAPAANPRAVAEGMAAADPTAAADLQKQEQEADQTEKEVQQEADSDGAAN
jgi:hypothetical protein